MPTCFFFSSRRRYTSLQGDWSSDVCSSDLVDDEATILVEYPKAQGVIQASWNRSEERRVGKECGCRWGTCDGKKKGLICQFYDTDGGKSRSDIETCED